VRKNNEKMWFIPDNTFYVLNGILYNRQLKKIDEYYLEIENKIIEFKIH